MSIPSLTASVQDRYDPEVRDRILALLQQSRAEMAYPLLTPAQLRALAETESPDAPVLSFYLQLTPERRVGNAWRAVFTHLTDDTLKPIDDTRKRQAMQDQFDRIRRALDDELPALGRGAAFFSCPKLGLWQQIAVSLPLPDGVHLGPRPYVRPLLRTRDEHDRAVLALLSQELSRFFIAELGTIEEVFQVMGDRLSKAIANRGPDADDLAMTQVMTDEAHLLAHVADLVLEQFEGPHLLLSGSPKLRTAVTQSLPKQVQQRLGGEFTVDVHASPADVAAAAEPALRTVEAREETATLQRVIDAGPDGAAWGEQPTLTALYYRQVMTLAADDRFAKPGARCRNCGALWATPPQRCALCGSDAMETVEDVVELAIEQAFEQRAALELVRSSAAQPMMTGIGPMAALLRW
jgi:peptide subunit release factor 1 (eRF1)